MEFGLSNEQTQLQDALDRFLTEQAPLDRVRQLAAGEATDAEIWQGLAALGVPGLLVSEAEGGLGLGALDAAVVAERLGYHATPAPFLSSAVMAPVALQAAGKRKELLAALASGEARIGIAFAEGLGARTGAGVKAAGGKVSGKSLYALDSDADSYLLADGAQRLYLVAAKAKGLARRPLPTVDATRSCCELVYDQAEAEPIAKDPAVFQAALDAGAVCLAADTLGAAQYALDQAVDYAGQRKQFNRLIGSFQAVKHLCAEMAAQLEPCRALVWYAAHCLDALPEEASMMASHAKAHLAEVGQFVTRTAIEVHGGMGFTDLLGLHYWFKRAGWNRQMLGSPEAHRERAARLQGLTAEA